MSEPSEHYDEELAELIGTDEGDDAPFEPVDADGDAPALTVESLLDDVERLTAELGKSRDDQLRDRAEYENSRKRLQKLQDDRVEQAAAPLVDDLLPVLDACDGAMLHGATEVEPVFAALLGALEKNGLERIDPIDAPFDPTRHDAVMHEAGDGEGEATVVDVLRRGYAWKGRVLRPAMVKVRG
jgi:molecular chaperone GrpE